MGSEQLNNHYELPNPRWDRVRGESANLIMLGQSDRLQKGLELHIKFLLRFIYVNTCLASQVMCTFQLSLFAVLLSSFGHVNIPVKIHIDFQK